MRIEYISLNKSVKNQYKIDRTHLTQLNLLNNILSKI